jgi:hypothetical protein
MSIRQWEIIITEGVAGSYSRTYRLEVPNGWLVKEHRYEYSTDTGNEACSVSICFYPDASHQWEIN